jgi:tetratricopeptide (TPR) repeat protein
MKQLTRTLMALLILAGGLATTAAAQDDQEYKRAYNAALEAARAKEYTTAYTEFGRAATLAAQAGDENIVARSRRVQAQIDYNMGVQLARAENYTEALARFNQGLEHDASFTKNYLGKGDALISLGQTEQGIAALKQAIENGDRRDQNAARSKIAAHYLSQIQPLLSKERPTSTDADAAMEIIAALKADVEPNADTHYYMAIAQRAKGDMAGALASTEQALELHNGSRTDKAKIYYLQGEIFMEQGDNASAKASFANATYGSFKQSAEHFLETL